MYGSARGARMATRAFCVCHRSVARIAAGVTWTSRTASAPWAARQGHTSVIDAAGAIYVIGGHNGTNYFNDVVVSTDGGADWTRRSLGVPVGVHKGYMRGT
jgi:hypothetical protein